MNNGPGMLGATTTSTTITETHVRTDIRWDPNYIKTVPGGLKLAAVVSVFSHLSMLLKLIIQPQIRTIEIG